MPGLERPTFDTAVGLCSGCAHARTVTSGRGSTFWMCELSKVDARFRKYPPLPVLRCHGFEPTTEEQLPARSRRKV